MLPPKLVICALSAGHLALVNGLIIFSTLLIFKIKKGVVTVKESLNTLNVSLLIGLLAHGTSTLMTALYAISPLFFVNLGIVISSLIYLAKTSKRRVYDEDSFKDKDKINACLWRNCICQTFYVICIIANALDVLEELETTVDWSLFHIQRFLIITFLTEILIAIVIYFVVAFRSIRPGSPDLNKECQKLYRFHIVRLLTHASLTYLSVVYTGCWGYLIAHIQILRWEIVKLYVEDYSLEILRLPGEIERHILYNKTCIWHLVACYLVYLFGESVFMTVFISRVLITLPVLLLEWYKLSVEEWGVSSVLTFAINFISETMLRWKQLFLMHFFEWLLVASYWYFLEGPDMWAYSNTYTWILSDYRIMRQNDVAFLATIVSFMGFVYYNADLRTREILSQK